MGTRLWHEVNYNLSINMKSEWYKKSHIIYWNFQISLSILRGCLFEWIIKIVLWYIFDLVITIDYNDIYVNI